MINSYGSDRGGRLGRRIAVLVSLAGVVGAISLLSASTASAGFATCGGTVTPKSKSNPGKAAKINFSCNTEIRSYSVVSTKTLASYTSPPTIAGTPSPFVNCEGNVPAAGFGCGIKDRNTPTNCGRAQGGGITGPPCTQVIPAGSTIQQDVTLKANPCTFKKEDPLQLTVSVGGEPVVGQIAGATTTYTVGLNLSEPFRLKVNGYGGCQATAKGTGAEKGAQASAAGDDVFPVTCTGLVEPKEAGKPSIDAKYSFSCNANIRSFGIVSNRRVDFFGLETEVTGSGANSTPCVGSPAPAASSCAALESSGIQCEGPIPSVGFGCGFPDRAGNTSSNLTYPRRLSAGNTMSGGIGFQESPCKSGKLKVWMIALGEPSIPNPAGGANTSGSYTCEPFKLAASGYGKKQCAEAAKKNA